MARKAGVPDPGEFKNDLNWANIAIVIHGLSIVQFELEKF